ncbi:MAG: zf-HC2 domain-containing protein [Candidatus Aminicenantes bacterium]|nr:zf-HC2 domain-containing protein [Candidatus Aminicenantes bacterium]
MPCLTVDRLYNYLDGALPPKDKVEVDRHLAECPACRRALEVRKRLAEAAEHLPPFAAPENFAACVMAKVPAAAVKKRRLWTIGLPAAAATVVAGLGLAFLLWGQSIVSALQKTGAAFGSYLQDALNYAAKGLKLLSLAGKIIITVSGRVLDTLQSVAEMVGPDGRAVLAGGALVIVITGGMLLRRRQFLSERTHDK